MKKLVLCILYIFCIKSIYANEQQKKSHHVHELRGYGLVGLTAAPAISSVLGFGSRFQYGHIGIDVSLDFSSLFATVKNKLCTNKMFYRQQKHEPPYNFSNHFSFKIAPSFLIFPHPNLTSEWYTGLGCQIGLWEHDHYYCGFRFYAPVCIIGKKYINSSGKKRFIELRVAFPTVFPHTIYSFLDNHHCQTIYTPIFTINYGFMF
jgi:hypothetical protein